LSPQGVPGRSCSRGFFVLWYFAHFAECRALSDSAKLLLLRQLDTLEAAVQAAAAKHDAFLLQSTEKLDTVRARISAVEERINQWSLILKRLVILLASVVAFGGNLHPDVIANVVKIVMKVFGLSG
jgi:hypothetical protein